MGRIISKVISTTILAGLVWSGAYCVGYPPPNRLISDKQRASFTVFKGRCEKPAEYAEYGSFHHNFGDSLLPRDIAIERARVLCAENIYRLEAAPLDVLENHLDELKEMRNRLRIRGEGIAERDVLTALKEVDVSTEHAKYVVGEIAKTSDYSSVRRTAEEKLGKKE